MLSRPNVNQRQLRRDLHSIGFLTFFVLTLFVTFLVTALCALRHSASMQRESALLSLSVSLDAIPKRALSTSPGGNAQRQYPCGDREWESMDGDDREMNEFLRSTFPDLDIESAFRFIVERADLYRYAVINEHGGMWMDSDAECQHPVKEWMEIMGLDHIEPDSDSPSAYILQNVLRRTTAPFAEMLGVDAIGHHTVRVTMVIGIEFYDIQRPLSNFGADTHSQFVQWAFLSVARNPILSAVIDNVLLNVVAVPDQRENIVARTGPAVFTKTILSFIEQHSMYDADLPLFDYTQIDAAGQLIPLLFEGEILWILVLPYRAFGYHRLHHWPPPIQHSREKALVYHQFKGSWK